jgi:RecA/RadA recombinase
MNNRPYNKEHLDQIVNDLYPKLQSLLVEIGSVAAHQFSTEAEQARLNLCLQHPSAETRLTELRLQKAFEQITRHAAEAATLAVLTIAMGSSLD